MIDLFPNKTVVFQWLLFMIALVTLHWGIFRPVLRILNERRARTAGDRERTKALDLKSEEMTAHCQKKVEEAKLQGIRKKEEIKEVGEKIVEELLKKTRAEVDEKLERIHQQIERETRECSLQLKQYACDLSREIAVRVLEREV